MTEAGEPAPDPLADALTAVRLCAIDPRLGGLILRGGGEARDAVVAALRAALPMGAPVRRMPVGIDDERLLGGIDLAATLAGGRAVRSAGLLAEAAGGAVIVPMAERLAEATAARIAAALDEPLGDALSRDLQVIVYGWLAYTFELCRQRVMDPSIDGDRVADSCAHALLDAIARVPGIPAALAAAVDPRSR